MEITLGTKTCKRAVRKVATGRKRDEDRRPRMNDFYSNFH